MPSSEVVRRLEHLRVTEGAISTVNLQHEFIVERHGGNNHRRLRDVALCISHLARDSIYVVKLQMVVTWVFCMNFAHYLAVRT